MPVSVSVSLFPSIMSSTIIAVFFLCAREYLVRCFASGFDGVFLPCDNGLDILLQLIM